MYAVSVQEISVSDFRQQCLTLMDRLPAEGIVITRHGHPVARLLPVRTASGADLIGAVPLLAEPAGSAGDLSSTGERWDADAQS